MPPKGWGWLTPCFSEILSLCVFVYLFLTDLVIAAVFLPLLCFLSMEFWLHPCLLWSMKSHLQYCWHVSYNVFPSALQRHYQRGLYLREIKIFWWSLLIEADEQNFKISFYVWPQGIKEQYIPWWLNTINLYILSCWFCFSFLNLIRLLCICVRKLIENVPVSANFPVQIIFCVMMYFTLDHRESFSNWNVGY